MSSRQYYAIIWAYGRACDERGGRLGSIHSFVSAAERDEWVDDACTPYTTQSGCREELLRSELTRAEAEDAQHDRLWRCAECSSWRGNELCEDCLMDRQYPEDAAQRVS